LAQDTTARAASALNNVNAARPETGYGLLPQAYGTTNTSPGIQPNLAFISRAFNYAANMLSGAAMWFGASQTFVALNVGTNCLDPFQTNGLTEAFFSVASSRQLSPIFNKVTNQVTCPFPAIADTAINTLWSMFETGGAGSVYYPNTTGSPQYGGMTLDLLNSQIGSTYVAWAFQGLKDDKQNLKTADAEIQNMIPTSSPLSLFTAPSTMNMLTTKNLNVGSSTEALQMCGTTMETLLTKIARKLKVEPTTFITTLNKNRDLFKKSKINDKAVLEQKRSDFEFELDGKHLHEWAKRSKFTMAPSRTSPDTSTSTILSVTSEDQLDPNHAIENMMQMPISAYAPVIRATDIERIVNGGTTAYEPGVMGSQSFLLENMGTAPSFVKDPTSVQGSEVTQELLRLSRGIAQTANLGNQFESVVSGISSAMPIIKTGATIVGGLINVGKKIAVRVRARRARRKANKA